MEWFSLNILKAASERPFLDKVYVSLAKSNLSKRQDVKLKTAWPKQTYFWAENIPRTLEESRKAVFEKFEEVAQLLQNPDGEIFLLHIFLRFLDGLKL